MQDHGRKLDNARACVFVENARSALRLVALDRNAVAAGLVRGMTLADARARVPDLFAAQSVPQDDERLVLKLASWCERFTPLVALDPPDGLMLDITGCGHLFGDDAQLRLCLVRGLARLGLSARGALASTPDAARALARWSQLARVETAENLYALSIGALEASEPTTIALRRAGLKTLGDLARLPAQSLAARFGAELVRKLARVLEREDARIVPLRPLPECMVERHFAEPLLDQAGMERALEPLMAEALDILEQRGEGGRLFEVRFFRADGATPVVTLTTSAPTREATSLMRLFRLRAAALADPLDPGFGFDAVRFCVLRTEPLGLEQSGFIEGAQDKEACARVVQALTDRLIARLGEERVHVFAARASHDPVRASFLQAAANTRIVCGDLWEARAQDDAPARPLRLFDPPQPIETQALAPDGPPARFYWRRIWRRVARAEGPERIAPEWWRKNADAPTRDYFRIEDEKGRRYWVFREGLYDRETTSPRWMLHGLFS